MNYHALSVLEHGHQVSLIGYDGEDFLPQLKKYHGKSLEVILFSPYSPPSILRSLFSPLYYSLRLVGLTFGLCKSLAQVQGSPDCILVQNPPTLPLLFIAYAFCMFQAIKTKKRPRLVVDWHNLGFTMFGRPKSIISRVAKNIERFMAPLADGNLCVSIAMKDWLVRNFGIQHEKINVLYDRPPDFFQSTNVEEMHDLMNRIQDRFEGRSPLLEGTNHPSRTLFTKLVTNPSGKVEIMQREDRPALLVSSTSWTPDEDFSILLNALVTLERNMKENNNLRFPHVVVIVTGKGPLKEMYKEMIAAQKFEKVTIFTMWLDTPDYPKLLGCADLGISLHVSTSGLDLPMKVLDMFGCEVPVCAVDFGCLHELVKDDDNGKVFSNEQQLAEQLQHLLCQERGQDNKIKGDLAKFRSNIRGMTRWRENWIQHAQNTILGTEDQGESLPKKIL